MKSTVVDESLYSFKPMYCSREYQASTRLSQQYEKSTPKYNRYLCDEEYTWESARTFGERLKEHFRAHSPIYDYTNTTGNHTSVENFSTVGRESHTC